MFLFRLYEPDYSEVNISDLISPLKGAKYHILPNLVCKIVRYENDESALESTLWHYIRVILVIIVVIVTAVIKIQAINVLSYKKIGKVWEENQIPSSIRRYVTKIHPNA